MSVQFGRWNLDGQPVERAYLERIRSFLSRYGPDGEKSYTKENLSIHYYSFHTTPESRREVQPHLLHSGDVICWDGRLDNREDLIRELGGVLTAKSTDLDIVATAFEQWETDGFGKLLGDWALAVWSPKVPRLILAKDFIGTRQLYYCADNNQITWSTILDPLVLFSDRSLTLNEEYLAGWFSFYPAEHLTPYRNVYSVPASSFVILGFHKHTAARHWDFDADKKTLYRRDVDYEEHFRSAFSESVRRRLRADQPVTAELSGGMDSSSIVCMADALIAAGSAQTPRVDTASYYNDAEPNWNEMPYIRFVEAQRGRVGSHINVGSNTFFAFSSKNNEFKVAPASVGKHEVSIVASSGHRVVLSGVGGDEVMGGNPNPAPELQDLLVAGQFRHLAHQLKLWALDKRVPWFHLLLQAFRDFLPFSIAGTPKQRRPAPWVDLDFVKRNRGVFHGYEARLRILGPRPSFQANIATLNHLRRQLACEAPAVMPLCDKRYPFLDRELLEFAYSVPRSQLVRPGRRRYLMRRALVGLVPNEIIERKRKAFVVRAPAAAITNEWASLSELCTNMISAHMRLVDQGRLVTHLLKGKAGGDVFMSRVVRTIFTEVWLTHLCNNGLVGESCGALACSAGSQ